MKKVVTGAAIFASLFLFAGCGAGPIPVTRLVKNDYFGGNLYG